MSQQVKVLRALELFRGGSYGATGAPVITVEAYNGSGGDVARGDVVVYKATSDFTADVIAFTTTTTGDDGNVMGMVLDVSIPSLSVGKIQVWGPTPFLKVDGTTDIDIGHKLSAFTTAKIAQKSSGAGIFAMALEAYTTNDSSGVIDAFISNLDFLRDKGADNIVDSGQTIDFDAAAGSYATFLRDVNNNELIDTQAIASAVNQFGVSNAATGNGPILEARGETDVPINILAKGTGAVIVNNGTDPVQVKLMGAAGSYTNEITDLNGNEILQLQGVTSAVNEVSIKNSATGVGPSIETTGESNVDLNLTLAGTGALVLNNGTDPVQVKLMGAAGTMTNEITDLNGNEILALQGVTSAVNEVTVANAATATSPKIGTQGGDTDIGLEVRTTGTGWLLHRAASVAATNGSLAFNKSVIAKTNDGTNTITAAEMRAGIWEHSGQTASRTDTTPTAAALVADIVGAQVGTTYQVVFANTDDASDMVIGAGAGVTIVGNATIAAGKVAIGIVHFTNVTGASEAVKLYLIQPA